MHRIVSLSFEVETQVRISGKIMLSAMASAVAPASPFLILALLTLGQGFFVGVALIALLFSTAQVLLLGIPIFLLLRHIALVSWQALTLGGFITALISLAILNLFQPMQSDLMTFAFFGAMGTVSGFVFWLTWHKLNI